MAVDSWIKFRTKLAKDGRLRIASRACHADVVTDVVQASDRRNALVTLVLGGLARLWCLADEHADEDGVLLGYTADDVDAEVSIRGFCAALPPEWIDLSGDWVKLPDYQGHNGTTGKSRAQATKRKTKERSADGHAKSRNKRDNSAGAGADTSRSEHDTSVTREEKSKEESLGNSSTHSETEDVTNALARVVVGYCQVLRKLGMQDAHAARPELIDLARKRVDVKLLALTAAELSLRNANLWNDPDLHPELLEMFASGATQQQMLLTPAQYQLLRNSSPNVGYLQKAVLGRLRKAAENAADASPRANQRPSATSIIKGTEYAPTNISQLDPELRAGVASRLND